MRRGAALPVVLFALAVSTGLAVGGLYVTRQLARSVSVSDRGRRLDLLAEGALAVAVAEWDSMARTGQPVGVTVERPSTLSGPEARATVWTTRLSERDFWLVAEVATTDKPLIYRRLGIAVSMAGGRVSPIPARALSELPD